MVWRFTSFLLFVSAAFAWPTWFVDRAGTAALGFAFLALGVGGARGRGALRGIASQVSTMANAQRELEQYAAMAQMEAERERFAQQAARDGEGSPRVYSSEGWTGDDRET